MDGVFTYVSPQVEDILGYNQEEMTAAGADWQMIYYGGAVHAFTNPDAGEDLARGAAYNANADKRSWQAMKSFFEGWFPEGAKMEEVTTRRTPAAP